MPHHGNEGSAAVGANEVAEVIDWTYDDSDAGGLLPSLPLGSTEETYVGSGAVRGGGTITCQWDETDTNGQNAMTVGASITLNLYPEGTTGGDIYLTGTAKIESRGFKLAQGGITTRSYTYKGVLAEGAVS